MTAPEQLWDAYSNDEQALLERVLRVLKELQFGSVEIVVHEGSVVQYERREKVRRGS